MGKFLNTTYTGTIDSLQQGTINKVKNANYVFNDKPPVISDWYNISKRGTTLDEATRAEYSSIDRNSPIRYNKILDAVFYSSGIRLSTDVDFNDEGLGLASQPSISGIVLPNTWIPYAGDFFSIKHAGKKWLYKVNAVSFDTIDNGNNVYSFEASLDNYGEELLEKHVVERYKMVINNVGTDFNAIIKEADYNLIDILDNVLTRIKNYYISLFYKESLQTFTYPGQYGNIYDPYMIEFLIRNNILSGSTAYVFVSHATRIPVTFSIEYDKSFFRALETHSIERFSSSPANANIIEDQYSLFNTVMEKYFKISYKEPIFNGINVLDPSIISDTKEGIERNFEDEHSLNNIVSRYFNDKHLDSSIIDIFDKVEFKQTPYLFYIIPISIFCIESEIRNLMSSTS